MGRPPRRASRLPDGLARARSPHPGPQKVPDGHRDFAAVRLKSEVSRVKERDLRVRDVTFESLRARGHEERVSVAPNGQQRRLVLAKVLVELWIHLNIARVVEEQIQLYVMRAGPGHVVVIQIVPVRRN